jgi:hypothetical protein
MALNKLKYNSLNLTPAANKAIGFDSDADALEATLGAGAITFIKKLTASSDSTLSFVDGSSDVVLDNTYKEYMFIYNNVHGATDAQHFQFQGNAVGGSGYNETITSTYFEALHKEDGADGSVTYRTDSDQAQGTSFETLIRYAGSDDADKSSSGFLRLFNPSSTTFVKHFIAEGNTLTGGEYSTHCFKAGYFNTTSAIDEIQFKFGSGNIDAGTITLYGIN